MLEQKHLCYLIIILIIYVLYNNYYVKENFGGNMNYLDQHTYLKCCRNYGCNSHRCRRFLRNKLDDNSPVRIGYLKHIDTNGKEHIISLYRQRDYRNTNKNKYYYQKVYGNDSHYEPIKTRTDIFDNDPVTINNKKYVVTIFDSDSVNSYYKIPYRRLRRRVKTIKVPSKIFSNYNYIGELENLYIPGVYYLYGKLIDYHRNLYKYLVLKKKGKKIYVVSKMNYHNQLQIGDMINIRIGISHNFICFF